VPRVRHWRFLNKRATGRRCKLDDGQLAQLRVPARRAIERDEAAIAQWKTVTWARLQG
jgi:hypothetical protein